MSSELKEEGKVITFWFAPGISEFINSENVGFKASFKVLPEDFIVTELTSGGNPVVLNNYEAPEETDCDSLTAAIDKKKFKQNFLTPPIASEVPPLQELISCDMLERLRIMATSYKLTLQPDPSHQINLGSYTN